MMSVAFRLRAKTIGGAVRRHKSTRGQRTRPICAHTVRLPVPIRSAQDQRRPASHRTGLSVAPPRSTMQGRQELRPQMPLCSKGTAPATRRIADCRAKEQPGGGRDVRPDLTATKKPPRLATCRRLRTVLSKSVVPGASVAIIRPKTCVPRDRSMYERRRNQFQQHQRPERMTQCGPPK